MIFVQFLLNTNIDILNTNWYNVLINKGGLKMTRSETMVNLIVNDVKNTINDYYSDWEIESWGEMLNAFGQTSADFKADAEYTIHKYFDENNIDWYVNDDLEIETEEGELISYRKWIGIVRKEIFGDVRKKED